MKKQLLLIIFIASAFFANAQNLITNGDFETAVGGYTVVESGANVLKHVAGIYDATTTGAFPTASTTTNDVATGQWVKKSPDDVLARGVILSTTGRNATATNCLNLKIGINSAVTGYNNSFAMLAVQRLTGLANDKRYLVSFWAKQDGTTNNRCTGVNVVLGDNVIKSTTAPLTVGAMLTGGTAWLQYTVVLDIPKYVASNPTADFTTAEFGFAITTPIASSKTAYAGVLIDDVVMTELTSPTIAYVKPVATGTGDGFSWANASADIQAAINSLTYGEVRVAAGTYTPSATLVLKEGVNLIGAYAADGSGTRDIWNNKTILDGAGTKRILMNSNTDKPFKYATKADGFILQNGNSTYGSAASLSLGAVLENCIIRNNTGGAVVGAAVYFKNNALSSSYSGNSQNSGSLINCIIINNTSAGGAGAVCGEAVAATLYGLINCVIANNVCTEASTGTGGVYIGAAAQYCHFQNSIFYNNLASPSSALNNIRNMSANTLNATLNNWFSDTTMPVTFGTKGGSIISELNKTATIIPGPHFELPTTFQGVSTNASQLAELEASNWRLKTGSGLIGIGTSTQVLKFPYEDINAVTIKTLGRAYTDIATDLMGSNRIINTTVDLGAYEYSPVAVTATNGGNGTSAGGKTVSKGTTVTLTSTPASGYRLANWTNGSVVGTTPSYTFVPTTDCSIQANFASNTVSVGANTNASSLVNCASCDITLNNSFTLTIDSTKTVNSITVAAGGKLTLNNTTALTATSGITLNNSASATSSFVDSRTDVSPTAIAGTVNQAITEANRNWYVSVPVTGQFASDITLNGAYIVKRTEIGAGSWETVSGSLTSGVGYIAVASANAGATSWALSGSLNSGKVEVPVTCSGTSYTGFNLLGNPYPSYLNWEQVLNLDATNASLLQPSIWYRTATFNDISQLFDYTFNTYNSAGRVATPTSTTGYIPPMQAFWVRATGAGTVTFTNAMRSHGDGVTNKLKVPKANSQKIVRLQVSNKENSTDETVVYFDANALSTYDKYDTQKMFNNIVSKPEIFTKASNEQLVINGMPEVQYDTEIPLGFTTAKSNDFSIVPTEMSNFEPGTRLILKDLLLTKETELSQGKAYNFSSGITTAGTSRFSLVFRSPSSTTALQNNLTLNAQVYVNTAKQITVIAPEKSSIVVFNAMGQKLVSTSVTGTSTSIHHSFAAGVYFITITLGGNKTTQKVIIN